MFSLHEIKLQDELNWDDLVVHSATATFFQTKEWLILWLKHFPVDYKIIGVYEGQELIGIAPLMQGSTLQGVGLLGVSKVLNGELVSDFGDIIAKKGKEKEVWEAVLHDMGVILGSEATPESKRIDSGQDGYQTVTRQARMTGSLELSLVREDSPSLEILKALGGTIEEVDVAPYLDLPASWQEYLESLDRHNRHELKRKMRKLEDEEITIVPSSGSQEDINELFRLMTLSDEKRRFLSEEMKAYFQDLIISCYKNKTAELMFMQKDNINIAVTLSIHYRDDVLLYNSGFDPKYGYLSAGLVLKAHLIKRAIEQNKKRLDFLRGNERYKYDLGGKERNLYKIRL